MLSMLNMQKSN